MKIIALSRRLKSFPPYLFAEIDRQKAILRKKKVDFIDVSIGDPDILAPQSVVDALSKAAQTKENQKYALDQGKENLRCAISQWLQKRFSLKLDENSEILPLIGSKEGLIHFPLAFVNPGEYIIVPSPGYPGYKSAARFVSAKIYELPLRQNNRFLPDVSRIPQAVRSKAKLMYLNYPHNPTTAVASLEVLAEVVSFCRKYGIILAYDNAYSEIYFDKKPPSIFEVPGAREIAVEFHSLSKTFCMTGFRIGWAAGDSRFIQALLKVKTNIDSGVFGAIQEAACVALNRESAYVQKLRATFKERRDFFVNSLAVCGFSRIYSDSTFYVWAKVPEGFSSSIDFSKYLLTKKNIVVAPGIGFGIYGEGFIRFALTVDISILRRVIKKLA